MIRPLTVATFMLACGSGLYLYQSKHEVQLLDRTIERAVHETGGLREQSRMLVAEWTMLNDPERLHRFSDTYLNLKTITPVQFSSLADLGNRLPSPRAEVPARGADEQDVIPTTTDAIPSASEPEPLSVKDEVLPVPPMPGTAPAPVAASVPHSAAASRQTVADSQPHIVTPETRSAEQRVARGADGHSEVRSAATQTASGQSSAAQQVSVPQLQATTAASSGTTAPSSAGSALKPIILAVPKSMPVSTQAAAKAQFSVSPAQSGPAMVAASGPYTGSLLGMAHGSAPSAVPRPTPLNATYNAN